MQKILFVNMPHTEEYRARIEEACAGKYEPVLFDHKLRRNEYDEMIPDTAAIIGSVYPAWLGDAPQLRWVQVASAGVNPFVGKKLPEGMALTNASGAFGPTIAEHQLSLLLALARRVPAYVRNAENGVWHDFGSEWQVRGKKALILGTGDLGTELAKRLKAFECVITGVCRSDDTPRPPYDRIVRSEALDRELPEADMVFGCLPSTGETRHMLNAERLAAMKEDAILINVGRGDLIDTEALTALLREGRFFGVGLDVTDPEPLPPSHPLWKMENVIITPHVAGISFGHLGDTQSYIWELALDNLARFCSGGELRNKVDLGLGY